MPLERVQPVEALSAQLAVESLLLLSKVHTRKVVQGNVGVLKLVYELVYHSFVHLHKTCKKTIMQCSRTNRVI